MGRFSGTEPLIRIFCEMPEEEQAKDVCRIYEEFLDLKYKANEKTGIPDKTGACFFRRRTKDFVLAAG